MTGSLEFIGLLLFMAGVELNPGPSTPDNNKTEIGKGQTDTDDSTRNMEEFKEEPTPSKGSSSCLCACFSRLFTHETDEWYLLKRTIFQISV